MEINELLPFMIIIFALGLIISTGNRIEDNIRVQLNELINLQKKTLETHKKILDCTEELKKDIKHIKITTYEVKDGFIDKYKV